jgi:hypothetical protein
MTYTEDKDAIIAEAERLHGGDDVMIDGAPQPEVTYGADGAWVQAWVRVPWDRNARAEKLLAGAA